MSALFFHTVAKDRMKMDRYAASVLTFLYLQSLCFVRGASLPAKNLVNAAGVSNSNSMWIELGSNPFWTQLTSLFSKFVLYLDSELVLMIWIQVTQFIESLVRWFDTVEFLFAIQLIGENRNPRLQGGGGTNDVNFPRPTLANCVSGIYTRITTSIKTSLVLFMMIYSVFFPLW